MIEKRKANVGIQKRGGNASKSSVGYKIIIPNAWAKKLKIDIENRECTLAFDPDKKEIKIIF